MTSSTYKLSVQSRGHPYVLSGALASDYWQHNFAGAQLPETWTPPTHEVHGTSCALADAIAWKEWCPLLSARAVEVLESTAPGCAEYRYFTDIKGAPYFVLNVLANGFVESGVSAPPLFRRGALQLEGILCTEVVPAAVVSERLTGFCFRDPARSETRSLFHGKETNVYPGILA